MGRMGRSGWGRGIRRGGLVAALLALGARVDRPATADPRAGAAGPPSVIAWLRVAPADPRRVYVGGFAVRGYTPGVDPIVSDTMCGFRISRSPDGGTSWHLAPVPILADIRYDPSLGCYGPGPLTLSPDGTHLFSLTEGYVVSVHRGTGLWFSPDGCVTFGSRGWSTGAGRGAWAGWILSAARLCRPEHRPQRRRPGAVLLPLDPQRDHLAQHDAVPEVVAQFVVGRAEARRGLEGAEPAHRPVSPLDAPVVLL